MIKTAIVGVGNCASSLVQSVYSDRAGHLNVGLSHPLFAGYRVGEIEFVAAFDIDERKIGKDLSDAIFSDPNCTTKYHEVPKTNVYVSHGPLLDGVADHMTETFLVSPETKNLGIGDITSVLKQSGAEVIISYLPTGADAAAYMYAEAALQAGCAFVNCMPARLATDTELAARFDREGLPLVGDDIKSQFGSTAIHRTLFTLLERKGATIDSSYQLNIGGNSDFMNMRPPARSVSKKYTKEVALRSHLSQQPLISVGPSDFVPHLKDNKVGFIHIEGRGLLEMPFSIDIKIQVEDSPNSAGVAVNAIRVAKTAIDYKDTLNYKKACSALFKNPLIQMSEEDALTHLYAYAQQPKNA